MGWQNLASSSETGGATSSYSFDPAPRRLQVFTVTHWLTPMMPVNFSEPGFITSFSSASEPGMPGALSAMSRAAVSMATMSREAKTPRLGMTGLSEPGAQSQAGVMSTA